MTLQDQLNQAKRLRDDFEVQFNNFKISVYNNLSQQSTSFQDAVARDTFNMQQELNEFNRKVKVLQTQLESQKDISINTVNPFGESISTLIQKPESKGLILIAGLVAAAVILK